MRIKSLNSDTGGSSYSKASRAPRLTRLEQAHRAARQAAIERSKSAYIKMVCGHYQTLQEDEAVSHWRPRKGVTYCDTCKKWMDIYRPSGVDTTPDQPMF